MGFVCTKSFIDLRKETILENIFDIALIVIIIIAISACCKLGIFNTLKPFRKIAAFLLAWRFKSSEFVTSITDRILKADAVRDRVSSWVNGAWGEKIQASTEAADVPVDERYEETFGIIGELFDKIKEYCSRLFEGTFGDVLTAEGLGIQQKIDEFTDEVVTYMSEGILSFVSAVIGFALIYFLVSVGFIVLTKILDKLFSKGLFGVVNRVAGGLVGVCYGFVGAWILAVLFVNIFPLVFPIERELILSGKLGVVEWFYNDFMLASLFGLNNKI